MINNNVLARSYNLDEKQSVHVRIDIPFYDGESYKCMFHVSGLGDDVSSKSYGEDNLQCVVIAMIMVAHALYFSKEYKDGRLQWGGRRFDGDLGLPYSDVVSSDINSLQQKLSIE